MLDGLRYDLRYGLRRIRHSPGFTITAVLLIGLGIGANAVVFSLLNALIFQPLPYPGSQDLVALFGASGKSRRGTISYPDLQDWRSAASSFAEICGWMAQSVTLTGEDEPARYTARWPKRIC